MSVLTIREKNQVTIPRVLLEHAGLQRGDPIELEGLPDGGVAIYRYGHSRMRQSAWDLALALADSVPGVELTSLDLPDRSLSHREVVL